MSPAVISGLEEGVQSLNFRSFMRISFQRRWLLALLGLVAVAAVACGGDDSPSSGASSTGDVEQIKANLPSDFQINVYQGEEYLGGADTVEFSNVIARGQPVVLNMWAGLCPPCRAEMPELEEVHQQFKDTIVLVGLDVGPFTGLGDKQNALDLIAEIGVTYPAGNTDSSSIVRDYELLGMPSTWFIRPNGEVMRKWSGAINASKLRELTQELIAVSG